MFTLEKGKDYYTEVIQEAHLGNQIVTHYYSDAEREDHVITTVSDGQQVMEFADKERTEMIDNRPF